MTVPVLTVPDLQCPLPPRISPYAEAAQRHLMGWLGRCRVPLDAGAAATLDRAGFARYAARLFPDAGTADLCVIAALFTWFFLLDDACDGDRHPHPERLRPLLAGALRIIDPGAAIHPVAAIHPGDPPAGRSGVPGPLRRMLRSAWREPRRRMPPLWRDRFADAVAEHFGGILIEATNKARGHMPGVAEYVRLRRATSAAYVSYALSEFVTGAVLPDAVYHHPAVRAYSAAGNDLLSWFNDMVSLDRDRATAGGHNLVLAIARERSLRLPAAMDAATGLWHARMAEFTRLRHLVPALGPAIDVPLRGYLDAVAASVRGTIDWSLESGRYRPPAAVARPGEPYGVSPTA